MSTAITGTIVNFLTEPTAGSYVTSSRVFSPEVTTSAQTFYASQIAQLKAAIQSGDAGGIIQAMWFLDQWSQMRTTDSSTNNNLYYVYAPGGNVAASYFTQTKPAAGTAYVDSTMDRYMAEQLDTIFRTLRSLDSISGLSASGLSMDPAAWFASSDAAGKATSSAIAFATWAVTTAGQDALKQVGLLQSAPAANDSLFDKAYAIGMNASLSNVVSTSTHSQSLQQLLMVDYVTRGNQLLYDQMDGLKTAIDQNSTALQYLNSLQDLMNQKDPEHFIMQLGYLNGTTYNYDEFEKATFDRSLGTQAKFTDDQLTTYVQEVSSMGQPPTRLEDLKNPDGTIVRNPDGTPVQVVTQTYKDWLAKASGTAAGALVDEVNQNFAQNPPITQIINNITAIISGLTSTSGSAQLTQALGVIKNDFTNLQTKNSSISSWVQDFVSETDQGNYQRHLNDATVASQSFNDAQREELRRVMFIFEEFYKSATSMLSKLTDLIEKMGSSIAR